MLNIIDKISTAAHNSVLIIYLKGKKHDLELHLMVLSNL